jgi:hypothetical protein
MDDVQSNNLTPAPSVTDRIKSVLNPQAEQTDQGETQEPETDIPQGEMTEGEEEQVDTDGQDGELYEVTVDGKKAKVTLDELVKGYQLEAHYTQKSQKLAEERKALDSERGVLSGINQKFEKLNDVVTYLQEANQVLEATLPPEPSLELAERSPSEYIKQTKLREQALRNLGVINSRMQQTRQQAQQIVAELQQYGAQVIQQKMPELLTQEGRSNLYGYLQTNYGYSPEDVNKNTDPNLFILAEKARRWDDMQSKTLKPDYIKSKAVKDKPKALNRVKQAEHQEAYSNFRKNPNERNAVQAIKQLLNK